MPVVEPAIKFSTGKEMIDYLCKADSNKFCDGGAVLNIHSVCNHFPEIPNRAAFEAATSLWSVCQEADIKKMCSDPVLMPAACPDGKSLSPSLCKLHPEKCVAAAKDRCTDNIYDCLATNQEWGWFCKENSELCFPGLENGE
jgi:hypothetical protein